LSAACKAARILQQNNTKIRIIAPDFAKLSCGLFGGKTNKFFALSYNQAPRKTLKFYSVRPIPCHATRSLIRRRVANPAREA
jgi:hypothetical protein